MILFLLQEYVRIIVLFQVKIAMVNLVEAVEVYDAACSCMESEPEGKITHSN